MKFVTMQKRHLSVHSSVRNAREKTIHLSLKTPKRDQMRCLQPLKIRASIKNYFQKTREYDPRKQNLASPIARLFTSTSSYATDKKKIHASRFFRIWKAWRVNRIPLANGNPSLATLSTAWRMRYVAEREKIVRRKKEQNKIRWFVAGER